MKTPLQDVVDLVNATLDGAELLARLQYVFASPAAFESDLECGCLFTPNAPDIPLRIDLAAVSCTCSRRFCPVAQRNTLVELYAFARGRDTVAAALELAELFDVVIDDDTLKLIEDHYLMLTQEALVMEKVGMAGRCFLTALLVCPTADVARNRVREMIAQLERPEDGAEFYLQFASYLELKGETAEARRVIEEEVLHLQPYKPEYQARLAALQKEMAPESSSWSNTMFRVCDTLIAERRFEAAQRCLARISAVLLDLAQIHERMAETYQGMKMDLEAAGEFQLACELYEKQRDHRSLLQLLDRLVRENPADSTHRRHSAEVRARIGDREGYARDVEALVRMDIEAGNAPAAIEMLQSAVTRVPHHLYIRQALSELLRASGDGDAANEHALASVDILLQQEMFEQAMEQLAEIAKTPPGKPALQIRLAELMASLGQLEPAADTFLSLGSALVIAGESAEAAALLNRVGELVPMDSDRVRKAVTELRRAALNEDAARMQIAHARALFEFGDTPAARAALAEIESTRPEIIAASYELADEITAFEDGDDALGRQVIQRLNAATTAVGRTCAEERAVQYVASHPADHSAAMALSTHFLAHPRSPHAVDSLANVAADTARPAADRAAALAGLLDRDDAGAEQGREMLASFLDQLDEQCPGQQFLEIAAPLMAMTLPTSDAIRNYARILHGRGDAIAAIRPALARCAELPDEEALALLHELADICPRDLELLDQLARREESAGNIVEATGCWRSIADLHQQRDNPEGENAACIEFLRLDPGNVEMLVRRADLHERLGDNRRSLELYLAALPLVKKPGQKQQLEKVCRCILALDPGQPTALEILADALEQRGEKEQAAHLWLRRAEAAATAQGAPAAIQIAIAAANRLPHSRELRTLLLDLYGQAGDFEHFAKTVAELAKLHLHDGDRNEAIVLLKTTLIPILEAEKFELIEEVLSQFTELLETSPNLLRYRAISLEGTNRPAEALELWMRIADLHRDGNRRQDEEAALRRAMALDQKDTGIRFRLIDALLADAPSNQTRIVEEARHLSGFLDPVRQRGELETALKLILSIDHEDVESLHRLARMMAAAGKAPDALDLYIRLGRAASIVEDWHLARMALESALALDSWNVQALQLLRPALASLEDTPALLEASGTLATVLEQQGDEDGALKIWGEIAEADRSNVEARIRLADACLERGNKERAIHLMREIAGLCEESDSPEEAVEMLHRLHELDPNDPFTLEKLGIAYLNSGDRENAVQHLRRAAELLATQKDLDGAIALVARLLAIQPQDIELHVMHAELLLELGHTAESAASYGKIAELYETRGETAESLRSRLRAVELDPTNTAARLAVAVALERSKEETAAAQHYFELARLQEGVSADSHLHAEKAAVLDPANAEYLVFLAQSRAARNDPGTAEAWNAAARIQLAAGEVEAARSSLREAAAVAPSSTVYTLLAELEHSAGEEDTAVRLYLKAADCAEKEGNKLAYGEALSAAVRLFPANTDILRKLGIFLRAEGKHDEGADWYLRAMEFTLEEGDVPLARHLLLEAGEVVGASDHLRHRAAEIFDDHELPELAARVLMEIARDLYRDGRHEEAFQQAESVLALQPGDAAAHQLRFTAARQTRTGEELETVGMALARRYHELSRFEEAAEVCRQVLDVAPESLSALEFLADILEKQGNTEEAIDVFDRWGAVLEKRQDWPAVVDALGRLLLISPGDSTILRRRVHAAEQAGQKELLCQDLMKLADLLTSEGKSSEAEELLGRVVDIDPTREDVQGKLITLHLSRDEIGPAVGLSYKLARASLDRGDSETAQGVLERIREHLRDDPEYHMLMGAVHQNTRSRGLAAREYMKALDLYRQRRDEEQVAVLVEKLLALDPLNLEIRQLQVDRLLKANAMDEAVDAMERLADACRERRLHDLAEAEYRRVLSLRPERYQLWKHVFDAHLEIGSEKDLTEEFMHFATMLSADGKHREAADYFRRVVQNDPRSLRARIGFVQNYTKAASPAEIVDDILVLAQALVDEGRVDESLEYFELATKADPQNQRARRLLSATQARSETEMRRRLAEGPGVEGNPPVAPEIFEDMEFSRTQLHMITDSIGPSDFLQGTIEDLDRKDNETTLSQIAEEYEDMLAMNPGNAELRIKLADVYQQMNRISEMLKELDLASEGLFKKGELVRCVAACERFLKVRPDNAKMRKRLNEALLKHDALRALDSAILYDEDRPH